MSRWRSVGALLAMVIAAATLGACGGGPEVSEVCTPPKTGSPPNCVCPTGMRPEGDTCVTDCTTTNVYQDSGGIPARTLVYDDFSVPDSGRLDVTLDWTVASNPMGFYLVPANTCTLEEFNARSCNFVVRSEPSTTKPKKISTPNFTAGNYRWIIGNYSADQESVSFQIVLQKGTGCAPLAGGRPSAAAAREGDLPPLERVEHR